MSSLLCLAVVTLTQAKTNPPIIVPFRVGDDAMIADAVVNGRKVSCMFDTGFSGSFVLDPAINVGTPTGSMTLRDFVGEMDASTIKIKSVSLGGLKVSPEGKEVVSMSQGDLSMNYGQHVDGIMGFEVVKDQPFQINFQKKQFEFYSQSYDITKFKPDNTKTFLLKMLPIGGTSIELIADPGTGKTMKLALDTGNAFFATTHRDVLERVGLWEVGRKPKFQRQSGVASGAVESWSKLMPPMKIFTVPVERTVWDIIDLPSSSAEGDGTVGFGFLKHFNITIDFARRRVLLERFGEKVENEIKGDVGISAGWDPEGKRTIIFLVSPESPADKAGIKPGDSLLAINDRDTDHLGYERIRTLLEGAVDSTVKIAYSRSGILRRAELKRIPLHND